MSTIISVFLEKSSFENNVRAFSVGLILPAALNTILWKKGMDPVELWIKRIYYCIITTGFMVVSHMAFNQKMEWSLFALAFGVGLAVVLFVGIPTWIIFDRREKKKLAEINKQLASKNGTDFH